MKMVFLGFFLISTSLLLCVITYQDKYPPASTLMVDQDGIIHHPTYGDYPKNVEFKQGMTLHPGQSADVLVEIPIGDLDDK